MSCILALDLGEKHIGVAISDGRKMIASPVETFRRRSRREDFDHVLALAQKHDVDHIVMGLPVHLDGREGQMATWIRDYGGALGKEVNLPVSFWDESFTSDMAIEALHAQGYSRKKMKQKGLLDAVAAALILQSFLDMNLNQQDNLFWGEEPPDV